MEISEKLDLAWMVAHGTKSIDEAHTARLLAEETARLAAIEAKRLSRERAQQERIERLKGILGRNPSRWTVSIDGNLVVLGKKSAVLIPCPGCGKSLDEVLGRMGDCMEHTFSKFWSEDFSNGDGRPSTHNSEVSCRCGKRSLFRIITVPY
jgi:hypothetical protein